jgi:hypothetical protein
VGLDKSKVAFLSSEIKEEDNPLYDIVKETGNVVKDVVKTIEAPVINAIGNYLKDPKNADNVKAIQEQLSKNFQGVINAFGMHYDEKTGQWYSTDDGIQKYFGYTDFYDLLTPLLGFDVDTTKVKFNYDEKDYTLRPWFGCYGAYSLVPGGENGIYVDDGKSIIPGADSAAQDEKKMGMGIQLYDRSGNLIMSTNDHGQKRYWQFGSNPMTGVQDKSNMYMEATLSADSDDLNFLQAMMDASSGSPIRFTQKKPVRNKDTGKYEATYIYDPNAILSSGGYAAGGYSGGGANGW